MRYNKLRIENGELRIHKEFVILNEAKNLCFVMEVGEDRE